MSTAAALTLMLVGMVGYLLLTRVLAVGRKVERTVLEQKRAAGWPGRRSA